MLHRLISPPTARLGHDRLHASVSLLTLERPSLALSATNSARILSQVVTIVRTIRCRHPPPSSLLPFAASPGFALSPSDPIANRPLVRVVRDPQPGSLERGTREVTGYTRGYRASPLIDLIHSIMVHGDSRNRLSIGAVPWGLRFLHGQLSEVYDTLDGALANSGAGCNPRKLRAGEVNHATNARRKHSWDIASGRCKLDLMFTTASSASRVVKRRYRRSHFPLQKI